MMGSKEQVKGSLCGVPMDSCGSNSNTTITTMLMKTQVSQCAAFAAARIAVLFGDTLA